MQENQEEIQPPIPNPNETLADLPDEILIQILSLIPTPDAIRTSVVSRRFRHLWPHLTSLDFSFAAFHQAPSPFFSVLVDRALLLILAESPITSFRLSFVFYFYHASYIDTWIRCALTRLRTPELHLDFSVPDDPDDDGAVPPPIRDWFQFRLSLLQYGSAERLSLTRAFIVVTVNIPSFGSVKSLLLDQVLLMDESFEFLEPLIAAFPNLEDLELRNGEGLGLNLRIRSASIKRLVFSEFYSVSLIMFYSVRTIQIDCPNLESLCFDRVLFGEFRLGNMPSVKSFSLGDAPFGEMYRDFRRRTFKLLALVPNVKRLCLRNWCFEFSASMDIFPETFILFNLRILELQTCYIHHDLVGMAALLERCVNLETLILHHFRMTLSEILREEVSDEPISLKLPPSLKEVKMLHYLDSESEKKFVTLLIKDGFETPLVQRGVVQQITLSRSKIDEAGPSGSSLESAATGSAP